jgi:hypothetical protein
MREGKTRGIFGTFLLEQNRLKWLAGTLEGKRPLERLRHRWENIIL